MMARGTALRGSPQPHTTHCPKLPQAGTLPLVPQSRNQEKEQQVGAGLLSGTRDGFPNTTSSDSWAQSIRPWAQSGAPPKQTKYQLKFLLCQELMKPNIRKHHAFPV